MSAPASDYLEVEAVARDDMLTSLWKNFGALLAEFAWPWGGDPGLGPALIVRVRARATGRVIALFEYGAACANQALIHITQLNERLAQMSLAEFCDDLGVSLQPDELDTDTGTETRERPERADINP